MKLLQLFLAVVALSLTSLAHAHGVGESYVFLNVSEDALSGRLVVMLSDLDKVVPLDADANGEFTEAEFDAVSDTAYAYMAPRLSIFHGGQRHPLNITRHDFFSSGRGTFARLYFDLPTLAVTPNSIEVDYRMLWEDVEPSHRGMLVIGSNTRTGLKNNESYVSLLFGPGNERHTLSLVAEPWQRVFSQFVTLGAWHIWIGFDHVLFLICLLLPSVLVLRDGRWQARQDFRGALMYVLKVVTLFTVAHSLTLSLSTLGVIRLPEAMVEAVIALSIAVVAVNNLYPRFGRWIWVVVFVFGMFHGLGFANVLDPLGVNQHAQIAALAGFNVGVELGQLAIIVLVFPLLFLMRNGSAYLPLVLRGGSIALIAVAMLWFVERVLVFLPRLLRQMLDWI